MSSSRTRITRVLPLAATALFLASCGGARFIAGEDCEAKGFTVTDGFPGARRGACTVRGGRKVRLDIPREDDNVVNPSPWFAFRIKPNGAGRATIILDYDTWQHRYAPKISEDGRSWRQLEPESVRLSPRKQRATLRIPLGEGPVWVSAQELFLPEQYAARNLRIAQCYGVEVTELGLSAKNHPIHMFDINPSAADAVILIGRQHPPEVSGAYAFYSFLESLLGPDPLATAFRERFRIIAIPLMNPDGVLSGNWRHNQGGVDLNRDWGAFTQPETKLVANLLDNLDRIGSVPRLFVDFHSTRRNLFYTQSDDEVTSPPGFTERWIEGAAGRLTNYAFTIEKRAVSAEANSKNYMYQRYGIPSVTYEVGDETERRIASEAARIFAREMMRLMLSQRG